MARYQTAVHIRLAPMQVAVGVSSLARGPALLGGGGVCRQIDSDSEDEK